VISRYKTGKHVTVSITDDALASPAIRTKSARWHAEVEVKHAELEARAVPKPVVARSAPATTAYQTAAPSL